MKVREEEKKTYQAKGFLESSPQTNIIPTNDWMFLMLAAI